MAVSTEQKQVSFQDFQRRWRHQVPLKQSGLLTARINDLTPHFKANTEDHLQPSVC